MIFDKRRISIKKTLCSPRTKVRGLSGFLDASKLLSLAICCTEICHGKQISCAQRAPRPKGRGFSKHVDMDNSIRRLHDGKRITENHGMIIIRGNKL